MDKFQLVTKLKPKGDQPAAIKQLTAGILAGSPHQTLLGVTGSGKTFTIAHVIHNTNRPSLIMSPNKTLAAQLYAEFKELFPHNAVHYFVSYYDYYQPEAYIPHKDMYIEKDAAINENLERLRLAATSSLMSRRDVIIVASVSCIYGLGDPEDYAGMVLPLRIGDVLSRESVLKRLIEMQYERNEYEFKAGLFRVRGESIEIFPAYDETAIKVIFGQSLLRRSTIRHSSESEQDFIQSNMDGRDEGYEGRAATSSYIKEINRFHPVSGKVIEEPKSYSVFPAKHFVIPESKIGRAVKSIRQELKETLAQLKKQKKLLEAQRLKTRTNYDLEMLQELGYCKGIENYSRHFSARLAGQRPYTLIDYFPKDFLCFMDESHTGVPQVRGMFFGDRARKEVLIQYGFRLPSALDNRPMQFDEWEKAINQVIYVSATPGPYEMDRTKGEVAEQIIRPTGLVDPQIDVRPITGQIDDLHKEMVTRIKRKERILVTTLTKRLAEDLSVYFQSKNIKGRYLHSEIDTIERTKILRELREGKFDVLVGVNLLREGLDLPEVSLVAILDADKEGFLRSATSIIQTVGRTARNVNGLVVLYADQMTGSMQKAIDETTRRRNIQLAYNKKYKITPKTIKKAIMSGIELEQKAESINRRAGGFRGREYDDLEALRILRQELFENK
jgi:excinuclease ABC subunit B